MDIFLETLSSFFLLTRQMAPYLLLGFLVAGLLHVFVPSTWVYRQFGKASAWSVLKGALLGTPLPLCSCGVLPVAASLKRSGASPPAVLSFLIATPVTGVDSILATYALMGTFLAVVRPVASVFLAVVSGLLMLVVVQRTTVERGEPGEAARPGSRSLLVRLRAALDYAFDDLLAGIARSVLFGLAVGAVIATLLPADLLSGWLGGSLLTYVMMVVVGTPLYVCATGSIPIAAALLAKGLSPGAALAFLIAGPATNMVAVAVAHELVGRRGVFVYLGTIVVGSVVLAWGVDALALAIGIEATAGAFHAHPESGWFSLASGIVLLLLLLYHLVRPRQRAHDKEKPG